MLNGIKSLVNVLYGEKPILLLELHRYNVLVNNLVHVYSSTNVINLTITQLANSLLGHLSLRLADFFSFSSKPFQTVDTNLIIRFGFFLFFLPLIKLWLKHRTHEIYETFSAKDIRFFLPAALASEHVHLLLQRSTVFTSKRANLARLLAKYDGSGLAC